MDQLLDEFHAISDEWERAEELSIGSLKFILDMLSQAEKDKVEGKFAAAKVTEVLNLWKELHVSVSKFAKNLEKKLKTDPIDVDLMPTKGANTINVDEVVQECLLHHFYRKGDFESADILMAETGLRVDAKLKEPYIQLNGLLASLKAGDIQPALRWAQGNKTVLREGAVKLEFELCRVHYLTLLRANPNEALMFARKAFAPMTEAFQSEIQTLMGCLAYSYRLEASPYTAYLGRDYLGQAGRTLSALYCRVQSLPQESAFTQCLKLGATSLPKLNRVMALMKERKGFEWSQQDELPVEMDLTNDLRFHTVFVCPVLRQQGTEANPPMMMPCGHVICQEALGRLSKGSPHIRFKCPYCPAESNASQAVRVHF